MRIYNPQVSQILSCDFMFLKSDLLGIGRFVAILVPFFQKTSRKDRNSYPRSRVYGGVRQVAGYIRLADKCLDKHTDPRMRRKIAKAKLREMVDGPLTQYQKILLDTLVPMFLEIHEMGKSYGEKDFDLRLYTQLQNSMRMAIDRYTSAPLRSRAVDYAPSESQDGPCDLGRLFGR